MPGYRFLEHMTDLEVEAFGKDLSEAFQNAGKAIEDTMVELSSIKKEIVKKISLEERDVESLLYAWIETLISLQDTEGMLFSEFECEVSKLQDRFFLNATISGEKFNAQRHEQKTAIKAPTYHAMKVISDSNGVTLRFLVDL